MTACVPRLPDRHVLALSRFVDYTRQRRGSFSVTYHFVGALVSYHGVTGSPWYVALARTFAACSACVHATATFLRMTLPLVPAAVDCAAEYKAAAADDSDEYTDASGSEYSDTDGSSDSDDSNAPPAPAPAPPPPKTGWVRRASCVCKRDAEHRIAGAAVGTGCGMPLTACCVASVILADENTQAGHVQAGCAAGDCASDCGVPGGVSFMWPPVDHTLVLRLPVARTPECVRCLVRSVGSL